MSRTPLAAIGSPFGCYFFRTAMATLRVCFGCWLFRTAACLPGPQWILSECVLGAKFSGPQWLHLECVLAAGFSGPRRVFPEGNAYNQRAFSGPRLTQHLVANPHVPTFFRYFKPISVRMALLLACSPDLGTRILNDPHIGIYSMYIYI